MLKGAAASPPPMPIPGEPDYDGRLRAWREESQTGSDASVAVMTAILVLFVLAMVGGFAYVFGEVAGTQKAHTAWGTERRDCIRREDRQFVDTGFLIFSGSGEVTTRNVCVEWRVTR